MKRRNSPIVRSDSRKCSLSNSYLYNRSVTNINTATIIIRVAIAMMMILSPIARNRPWNRHYNHVSDTTTLVRFVQSFVFLPNSNPPRRRYPTTPIYSSSSLFWTHQPPPSSIVSMSSRSDSSTSSLSSSRQGKESSQPTSSSSKSISPPPPSTSPPTFRLNLSTVTLPELEDLMIRLQVPKYRGQQIYHYIRHQGITDVHQMVLLPKTLRQQLQEICTATSLKLVQEQVSSVDGTVKRVYELHDASLIESVLMGPYQDGRYTACISSQVGCAQACVFCATGQMGFTRQLSAAEIFEQVATYHALLLSTSSSTATPGTAGGKSFKSNDNASKNVVTHGKSKRLSNVVFMGMGEVRNESAMLSVVICVTFCCCTLHDGFSLALHVFYYYFLVAIGEL